MGKIRVHLDNYFNKTDEEKESIQDEILNQIVLLVTYSNVELKEVYDFFDQHISESEKKEQYETAQYFLDLKNKIIDLYT